MMLLPEVAGEGTARNARTGAKRALPALSPLAMLNESLELTIRLDFDRVNGIRGKPSGSSPFRRR